MLMYKLTGPFRKDIQKKPNKVSMASSEEA